MAGVNCTHRKRAGMASSVCPSSGSSHRPTDVRSVLGAQLRKWRQRKAVSLKAMAIDMGVSESTLSLWESGRRFPSADNLNNLSQYLGLPHCLLLCTDDCPATIKAKRGSER